MEQHNGRLIRDITITKTGSRYWPNIAEIRFGMLFTVLFFGGFGISYLSSCWLGGCDWIIGLSVGAILSSVLTGIVYTYILRQIYQPEITEHIQEFEDLPEPAATITDAIIDVGDYTMVIHQPADYAFRRWARDVLSSNTTHFSVREASRRGFDHSQVLGQLKRAGLLERTQDGNGVYRLNQHGKAVLEEWLDK